MEDAVGFVRNREVTLNASTGGKRKSGQSPTTQTSLKGSYQHLEVDEKWSALNKKEKQLCIELNIKPTSYWTLKR